MAEKLKRDWMKSLGEWGKRYRYPVLILAVGVLLMLLPSGTKKTEPMTAESQEEAFELEAFTEAAEKLLSGIRGAGQVKLLFALTDEGTTDYLTDETMRQQEDNLERDVETVLRKAGGDEEPLIQKKTWPLFRGAVILCQGADNPQVELGLKEAISSLTGLGMDKITVLKMD